MLFNPLTMTCCDLVPQRKSKTGKGKEKGPRKRPVPMKGLYSTYEFLPLKGGASTADIDNFIIKIILNSIRASINLSIDGQETQILTLIDNNWVSDSLTTILINPTNKIVWEIIKADETLPAVLGISKIKQ